MLGNTPLQQVDFHLDTGKSFAFTVRIEDELGAPLPLDDCILRMFLKEPRRLGGAIAAAFVGIDVGVDGARQFQMQAPQLALTPAEYTYDLTLETGDGYSTPLMKGVVVLGPNTDPFTSNTYSFVELDDWITVTLKNSAAVRVVVQDAPGLRSVWQGGTPPPGGPGILNSYLKEAIRDVVAEFLQAGANVTLVHNDELNTLTISSAGGGGTVPPAIYPGVYPGPTTFPGGA